MQTCVGATAGLAFTGGFGSYLIAMDHQSYLNLGSVKGNNLSVSSCSQDSAPNCPFVIHPLVAHQPQHALPQPNCANFLRTPAKRISITNFQRCPLTGCLVLYWRIFSHYI